MVVFLSLCLCGGAFVVVFFVVVFLWWCFCGGVFVLVFLCWCFCGGVSVVVFLWWCLCGVVAVVFLWCSCGSVFVVEFLWRCTKYYSSTTKYYSVLQSTNAVLLVLQSTTPVLLRNYKVLQRYYSVLQSTTPYYKVLLQYYKVLLRTTKYYSSTTKYYSAQQSNTPVLLRTTKYYCTPVLLRTTKYYSSTTPYYKVLLQYYSNTTPILLCTTKHYSSTTPYYRALLRPLKRRQNDVLPVLLRTTPVLQKLPKRAFRARLPQLFTEKASKRIVSCEASSKFHRTSFQNERFARCFFQISQNELPKRAFRAMLPTILTEKASKMTISCEASSKFHRTVLPKRAVSRDASDNFHPKFPFRYSFARSTHRFLREGSSAKSKMCLALQRRAFPNVTMHVSLQRRAQKMYESIDREPTRFAHTKM